MFGGRSTLDLVETEAGYQLVRETLNIQLEIVSGYESYPVSHAVNISKAFGENIIVIP